MTDKDENLIDKLIAQENFVNVEIKQSSPRSSTKTLITAIRMLSDDDVANAVIAEAADRLEELTQTIDTLNNRLVKIKTVLENAYEMSALAACCKVKNAPEFLYDLRNQIIKTQKEIEEMLK